MCSRSFAIARVKQIVLSEGFFIRENSFVAMTDFEAVDDALLDVVATINRKLPDEAPRINQESRRQFQSAERALDKLSKNDDLREIAKALESTNRTLADVLEDWGISDRHISEGFEFIEERQLEREAKKLQDREDIERSDVDLVDRTMSDVESEQLRDGLVVLFDHADRVVQAGSKNAPGD